MFGFNIFDPRLLRFCTKHKKAFFKKSVENYGVHQRIQILEPIEIFVFKNLHYFETFRFVCISLQKVFFWKECNVPGSLNNLVLLRNRTKQEPYYQNPYYLGIPCMEIPYATDAISFSKIKTRLKGL